MTEPAFPDLRPLIFWEGFPPCALMIKQVAELFGDRLVVLGTRPAVPFEGLEVMLGHRIVWLENPNDIWDRREEFADRNFIIHTGWAHKGWLKFDRWMRPRGAYVVVAVDNRFKGNLRQYVGALWFRFWLSRCFDATIVPGRSATRLMRFFGMPVNKIRTGYYGAFEDIYSAGPAITSRPKEFLFVGQLIARKGVDILLEAFRLYRDQGGDWDLRIIGSGSLEHLCVGDGIIYEGFGQANLVSQRMKQARCLVSPSREDHWATVVCEAAASGTLLIASRFVGASEDLIRTGINGVVIQDLSAMELFNAMLTVSKWPTVLLENGRAVSLGYASGYTSASYLAAFTSLTENAATAWSNEPLQLVERA